MAFKLDRQLEKKDCGPTCLKMIARSYGKDLPIVQIRDLCETSKLGTSAFDLKLAGEKLGFKALLVKGQATNLTEKQIPTILYWHPAHFVVLYKISQCKSKKYYHIADPGYGKIKLDEETFRDRWEKDEKGIAILFEPTADFYNIKSKKIKEKKSFAQLWEMYRNYLKPHKGRINVAFFLTVLAMLFSWFMPFLFKQIVDVGIIGKNFSIISWLLIFQFILIVGNFLSRTLSSLLLMRINFQVGIQSLTNYLYKIIKLPISIFDRKQTSDFIVKLNDISRIQNFMSAEGISLFLLIINLLVFLSILIYFSISIFVVVFILMLTGIGWSIFFMKKRKRLDYELTRLQTENNLAIHEMVHEMAEIKINNAQNTKVVQWSDIYKKQTKTILASLHLNYWQTGGANLFSTMASLAATAICAYLVINNRITLGVMMSIGFIVGQITVPMEQLIYLLKGLQEVSISNERVQEIYTYKEENDDRKLIFSSFNSGIWIKDLSFKYLGSRNPFVLQNINLFIPKNTTTAIVGVSGSGKTTLLKLLLGFYAPTHGNIYIDDINFEKLELESFRNKIGVVMQNGHIYSNTIVENIAISDLNPNIERVMEVSKIACLDDFINRLPQKYNTRIGKNGIELSGGQKQRILIARALYNDPQILFLDEATSALDSNTEKTIVENLNLVMQNRTVIIIAHRFSTIKAADQIVVIHEGRISEVGNHTLLTNSQGEYFKLVKNQLDL